MKSGFEQDFQLVEDIRAGDKKAETELFHQFGTRIARKVYITLGRNNEDWKDVVAEIQLALLTSLRAGKFDPQEGNSLGSYIYGITMNKIRDYFKSKKRQTTITHQTEVIKKVDAAEVFELEKEEIRVILRKLIIKLKPKYQEVLYLRFFKEYSIDEISTTIRLPHRRVSERIHYAIKLLRSQCEKDNLFSILRSILIILI